MSLALSKFPSEVVRVDWLLEGQIIPKIGWELCFHMRIFQAEIQQLITQGKHLQHIARLC